MKQAIPVSFVEPLVKNSAYKQHWFRHPDIKAKNLFNLNKIDFSSKYFSLSFNKSCNYYKDKTILKLIKMKYYYTGCFT